MSERRPCECEWGYHKGEPCLNYGVELAGVRTNPELCTECLLVCCAEEEDEPCSDSDPCCAGC